MTDRTGHDHESLGIVGEAVRLDGAGRLAFVIKCASAIVPRFDPYVAAFRKLT
jgi:hypothetical protein